MIVVSRCWVGQHPRSSTPLLFPGKLLVTDLISQVGSAIPAGRGDPEFCSVAGLVTFEFLRKFQNVKVTFGQNARIEVLLRSMLSLSFVLGTKGICQKPKNEPFSGWDQRCGLFVFLGRSVPSGWRSCSGVTSVHTLRVTSVHATVACDCGRYAVV